MIYNNRLRNTNIFNINQKTIRLANLINSFASTFTVTPQKSKTQINKKYIKPN